MNSAPDKKPEVPPCVVAGKRSVAEHKEWTDDNWPCPTCAAMRRSAPSAEGATEKLREALKHANLAILGFEETLGAHRTHAIKEVIARALKESGPSHVGASEPQCAGPFVDARDCPVHRKDVRPKSGASSEGAILDVLNAALYPESGCKLDDPMLAARTIAAEYKLLQEKLQSARSATLPRIKGGWIDRGYVVLTPEGVGEQGAKDVLDACKRLFVGTPDGSYHPQLDGPAEPLGLSMDADGNVGGGTKHG